MFDIAKHSFELSKDFVAQFKGQQPQWDMLGYFTYKRTYARDVVGENRTEEFWETCRRVVEGTFSIQKNFCIRDHKYWDEEKSQRMAQRMFKAMWTFRFLPPGRGLWSMGADVVYHKGGAVLNNCAFTSTDNIDKEFSKPFLFVMDMSMLGVGCGFDVKGANKLIIKQPAIIDIPGTFVIQDTRESWCVAVSKVLDGFLKGNVIPYFDYSKIRDSGTPIKTFGGTASGAGPLVELIDDVRLLLGQNIGKPISSTIIVDIMNMIGRCVVSGNVRRSAEIAFGSPSDKEFMKLKLDNDKLSKYRWASNNSIFAEVGMDYEEHAEATAINGEPGYFYLDNARAYGRMKDPINWIDREAVGGNPCLEQTLHNYELCTLVETFPAKHESLEDYLETLKIAYLYAKTVTLVPTHWSETNAVIARNRRIGLSQSGIIKAFGKHGRREMLNWCDKGYEFINSLDIQYSNWLGVPRSIKKTSVKPSGTVSILAGEPPGIHYPHSEYYIRRIRLGIHSPLCKIAQEAGYHVEPVIGQSQTMVVSFPIKEEFFEQSKDDVSIWEQVENAVAYQREWADNQVSITVTFKPSEKSSIKRVLEMNEDKLKGISFLPLEDHKYVQAPYETITKEKYEEMSRDIKPMKLNNSEHEVTERFCDGDKCTI